MKNFPATITWRYKHTYIYTYIHEIFSFTKFSLCTGISVVVVLFSRRIMVMVYIVCVWLTPCNKCCWLHSFTVCWVLVSLEGLVWNLKNPGTGGVGIWYVQKWYLTNTWFIYTFKLLLWSSSIDIAVSAYYMHWNIIACLLKCFVKKILQGKMETCRVVM